MVDGDVVLTDGDSPSMFVNMAIVRRPLTPDGWKAVAGRMHEFYAEQFTLWAGHRRS